MPVDFDDSATGKDVVYDGETVGVVVEVRQGTAYVEPDPGLGEKLLARLGWADADEDAYPLQEAAVDTVTDDEIRLEQSL